MNLSTDGGKNLLKSNLHDINVNRIQNQNSKTDVKWNLMS